MKSLKLLSWNIQGGLKREDIISCIKEIHPDVIALQEVLENTDGTNNAAEEIAKALGYEWIWAPTKTLDPDKSFLLAEQHIDIPMRWGNAVLSRYPIVQSVRHELSETRMRTALQVTIALADTTLDIFSTHLVHVHADTLPATRLEQVEALLQRVPSMHAIVMGDFNAVPESDVILKMNSVLVDAHSDAPQMTRANEKIDYIFTTRDIPPIASEVIISNASDHMPVCATIGLL